MSARDASVGAYHDQRDLESGQLAKFERYFKDNGPATRAMAGEALEFGANVYSARVNRLVKEKKLIELPEKKPCEVTGYSVGWLVHRSKVTLAQLGITACADCQKAGSGIYTLSQICCAARFVLSSSGDMNVALEATASRGNHDPDQLRLACNAMHRARRQAVIESAMQQASANEDVV